VGAGEEEKRLAAEAAAELVEDGMTVGLGTGSTVAFLLPALAARGLGGIRGWLIKGGGGAHLREKIVAAAAERFVVIADSSKPVDALTGPVPVELFAFGLRATLARLGPEVEPRAAPPSPDGGAIADYRGEVGDPATLAARLEADPGVAAHGLFPPAMVSELLVGTGGAVERTGFP
jgi:ribose 5-phosphate isomerase A